MASSSLSRYRLAILAVTALAAGCSIYYIRQNFWDESLPSPGLRRRNAVHRPRPRRNRQQTNEPPASQLSDFRTYADIDAMLRAFDEQGPNHVYGRFERQVGTTLVWSQLTRNHLPSASALQETFLLGPDLAEALSLEIEECFVEAMLAQLLGPNRPLDVHDLQTLETELTSRGLRLRSVNRGMAQYTVPRSDSSRFERLEMGSRRRQGDTFGEDGGLRQNPPDNRIDWDERDEGSLPRSEAARRGPTTPLDLFDLSAETVTGEEAEESGTGAASDDESKKEGQSLLNLIYYIAEDQSRKDGYVHHQVTCNQCNACPIRGIRYRCANCMDFDLCEQCESTQEHSPTHIFYKVRIPVPFPFLGNPRQPQPIWYPGKPYNLPRQLPRALVQRLSRSSKFEDSEVMALWDQFRCLASQPWQDDPYHLGMAVDHSTFDKCFVPSTSLRPPPPNMIYDLMFSFYDTDGNGLIGFEEFVMGLACLREKGGKANHDKLLRIFTGYDLDRDGYVSRKDFLRMFRAYYALMKELTRDMVASLDEDPFENNPSVREVAAGSQPLSSTFSGPIPRGQPSRTGEGKTPDRFGDLILPQGHEITGEGHDGGGDHHEAVGDIAEHRHFGNVASQTSFRRFRNITMYGGPNAVASFYNLGDRALNDREYGDDSDSDEYTPNDDRDIIGANSSTVPGDAQGDPTTGNQGQGTNPSVWPPDWVDPADAEKALGPDTQLKDVMNSADRSKVEIAAIERIAQEDRDHRRHVRDEGVAARWQRRHFYLDEEDGAPPPDDYDESIMEPHDMESTEDPANGHQLVNGKNRLSRRSRSSSKVRFEDDVMDERCATRSRSSTSVSSRSIPVGERWGGFELPEPEKHLGREVLYQVTHEALNEMLDPIFKYREDLAMEALQTKSRRVTSKLKEHYDAVPDLEKLITTQLYELLRQRRKAPEQGPHGRSIWISDLPLFLQDVAKEEVVAGSVSNGLLKTVCKEFGLSLAQASFQAETPKMNGQAGRSMDAQRHHDEREETDEPKTTKLGSGEKSLRWEVDEEKEPAKSDSPAYQDDPDVVYPEAALELQDAVSAFNEVDSAPREAAIGTKPLSELLAETGYAIVTPEVRSPLPATAESEEFVSSSQFHDSGPDPTMPQNRPNMSTPSAVIDPSDSSPGPDPTLPQNRPDSLPSGSTDPATTSHDKAGPSFLYAAFEPHQQTLPPDHPIDPQTLKYYAFLDCIEKEDRQRGGPGRMNFEEFEEIMTSDRGKGLSFVGAWIDLASF